MTGEHPKDPFSELPWPQPVAPPEPVSNEIRKRCLEDMLPCHCGKAKKRLVVSVLVSLLCGAIFVVIGRWREPFTECSLIPLLGALLLGVVQASVLFSAHGCAPGRRGPPRFRLVLGGLVLFGFFAHVTLRATEWTGFSSFVSTPAFLHASLKDASLVLAMAALPTLALFFVWRRTDPFTPRLTGALTGLAGGLVGSIAMDLICFSDEAWHLLFGHAMPLVVCVLIGVVAGKKWLTP